MSMISDATRILIVTTQFSLAKVPGRLWRVFRKAYNPWIEPSRKLPRDGEAVECRLHRGPGGLTLAWCFRTLTTTQGETAAWYVTGPSGETRFDGPPLLWRRAPRRKRSSKRTRAH